MDQTLRFEHLVSETFVTYINLPAEEEDKMMKKDLGRLSGLMAALTIGYIRASSESGRKPLFQGYGCSGRSLKTQ